MADLKEVCITDIEEFDSVDVVSVLVADGDQVEKEQPLFTIESEKAMMDYPSPHAGVINKIAVKEGSQVKEGDLLAVIEVKSVDTTTGSSLEQEEEKTSKIKQLSLNKASEEKKVEKYIEKSLEAHQSQSAANQENTTGYASPSVHEYARELGVDLSHIEGSGRQQRITKEDVQDYVRKNVAAKSDGMLAIPTSKDVKPLDFSSFGETEAIELTKIQIITAKNMQSSWQNIPHVTHFEHADVTLLEQHRQQLSEELKSKEIKLTPLAFVVKALVSALKQFPQFNSSLDIAVEKLILKKYFHIGIAVDTPHGLLVPVLRDVDKKTTTQVAIELVEISNLARERKISAKQMTGGSMTISSLGALGGRAFTPIINPPEVAVLGVSKMIIRDTITESGVEQQKILPLSLSYDHRVINGADAARFCTYLKGVLEDIWKLIL